MTLSARLRTKLAISPVPKRVADDCASSTLSSVDNIDVAIRQKRSSPRPCNDSLDSFDSETYVPAPLTPAPKKMKRGNKKQEKQVKVTKEVICDRDTISTKKSTKRPAKPALKKRAIKKKIVELEDLVSSDDESFDEDIDVGLKESEPLPSRSRSTRGRRAVVKYAEDDGSDDESDVELDDESDNESDF